MKIKSALTSLALILCPLFIINCQLSIAFAQGTAFTYQGRLSNNGSPANGSYDFRFRLAADPLGNNYIGSPYLTNGISVSAGLFTTMIDFGSGVFTGSNYWLEVDVRTNGAAGYTVLNPLQAMSPAPYAIYAAAAGTVTSGLTIQQNTNGAPDVIGGSSANYISSGAVGAVIAGGGATNYLGYAFSNSVTGDFGTVGGGEQNTASSFAIVGGGENNSASGYGATVGGGEENNATASSATIGGGNSNTANNQSATVGGGYANTASGLNSTVAGGEANHASGDDSFIGGGWGNTASGPGSVIGGGGEIVGVTPNIASALGATVAGGMSNNASGANSTIGGGSNNVAGGRYASVLGGNDNQASGDFSFAGGNHARAPFQGDFVWADDNGGIFSATANNQFYVRAGGGVYFYTGSGTNTGATLAAGSSSWSMVSDRNAKENFQPVDAQMVLTAVTAMPMTTWNYKTQAKSIRHVGPMAQDFAAAFQVGENDTTISTVDEGGVALAAIQGLNQKLEAQRAENADLKARLAKLEQLVSGFSKSGEAK